MFAYHRYALVEALLTGNSSARWILADLLSEEGENEEADFVRNTRTTREGNLDVAIRQLPCPEVVELGCDLIEHVAGDAQPPLGSLLARVRRLLRRRASAEQVAAGCRGLSEYRAIRRLWYDDSRLIVLDDAVHSLASALRAASMGLARDAGIAVAAAGRTARGVVLREYRVKRKPNELQWQIRRTLQLVSELLGVRC